LLTAELNFVDSYKYNIAAYALAELLGMDDIVPVYVERKWQGNAGSLSWWSPVKMEEADRRKQQIYAPERVLPPNRQFGQATSHSLALNSLF
jgi:hypothetical protein